MKVNFRRLVSVFCSLAMCAALLPAAVLAEDPKVAQMDDGTTYSTLQEAVNAAGTDAATITLLDNTNETVTIPAGANITIDIAEGVTLTGTDSGHAITNNGTLTVTGKGTVVAMASNKAAVENTGVVNLKGGNFTREVYPTGGNWYVLDNQGTMNISDTANVSAEAPDASLIRNLGTSLEQKATLNISGGTITQDTFIAVKNDDYGVLNITGGTINSDEQAVQNWHQATITGGTMNGRVLSCAYDDMLGMDNTLDISGTAVVNGDVMSVTYDGAVPQVAITGGTVNGKLIKGQYVSDRIQALPNDSDMADIVVSGGTFNQDVTDFVIDGNKTVFDEESGKYVLAPDTDKAVAVYNGKGYMTLKEALDAAGNGPANVSLTNDTTESVTIPAGADITLDIAKDVTLTGTASDHAITNNGTLTVTGEGTVKAMAINKGAVENFGTAYLKGAKFTRKVYTPGGNWYVLDNQGTMNISDTAYVYAEAPNASLIRNLGTSLDQKATLNISGGTITQNTFIAVKNDDYGVLNITGGTITSVEQAVQNWHKATITGGTISGPVISWAYDDKPGMDNTLDISGTAVVNGNVMSVTYDGAVPQVAITGGTVNGKLIKGQYVSNGIQALPNDSEKADIVVSGGTFNNAVPEEFCAENFHPNRNPDGSYSVHTHQFGPWVTTVRPGHTTSGTEVQTCTVCGYEIARTIAPTGNNDHPDIEQAKQDGTWGQEETSTPAPTATAAPAAGSVNTVPQTGDEMPLAVLGGAAALAAAAMVVLILRKRRVF